MLQSSIVNVQLQKTPYYPFTLDGPLCPLLNDAEVLSSFYAEESLHHTIKQFCKRTTWPGKPAASYSVDSEKLKELLISLFNSPIARATLQQKSEKGRCDYLDNAIWQWFTTANPTLRERISGCCDDIKGKLFSLMGLGLMMRVSYLPKFMNNFTCILTRIFASLPTS